MPLISSQESIDIGRPSCDALAAARIPTVGSIASIITSWLSTPMFFPTLVGFDFRNVNLLFRLSYLCQATFNR